MFLHELRPEQRRAFLVLARQVIDADNRLAIQEVERLDRLYVEAGVGTETAEAPNGVGDLNLLFGSERSRVVVLLDLLLVAYADGQLHPREIDALRSVAARLDVDAGTFSEAVDWARAPPAARARGRRARARGRAGAVATPPASGRSERVEPRGGPCPRVIHRVDNRARLASRHTLCASVSDQKIIFSMLGVGKTLPTGKKILDNIYLSFYYGAKIGVLGLNGAGKSTLLRIIAGDDDKHDGEIQKQPGLTHRDAGAGARPGRPDADRQGGRRGGDGRVRRPAQALRGDLGRRSPSPTPTSTRSSPSRARSRRTSTGWAPGTSTPASSRPWTRSTARPATRPSARSRAARSAAWRSSACFSRPRTCCCSTSRRTTSTPRSVAWLEQHLAGYPGTVIAVTHDRYFLDNVAGWILELDRGKGIPFEGNYTRWLEQKEARLQQEEKDASKRQKTIHQELEWVRQNAKGQRTKSKARIARYEELQAGLSDEKRDELEIYIPPGPRLGNVVVQAEGVEKGYGDRTLVEDLTFDLPPGGIVGIVGPNGAGKTTLFRMITGSEEPDAGSFRVGETVQLGYVNQERDLDPDKTVWQTISGGADFIQLGTKEVNSRAYVGRFNFGGADQQKKVGTLSGGERGRLQLAVTLKEGANVLLLDEPTNDLDVNTLRALEEALLSFGGCAVVISHDRWFLNRVATHILAFEDDGVFFYPGNYAEYEDDRKRPPGHRGGRAHRPPPPPDAGLGRPSAPRDAFPAGPLLANLALAPADTTSAARRREIHPGLRPAP